MEDFYKELMKELERLQGMLEIEADKKRLTEIREEMSEIIDRLR